MKKLLIILFLTIVLVPFDKVYAVPGCCSWHGGEAGCRGRKTLCADGTVSSCECDGTSDYSGNDYTENNYVSDEDDEEDDYTWLLGLIVIALPLAIPVFVTMNSSYNEHKRNKQKEYETYVKEQEAIQIQEQKEEDFLSLIDNIDNEDVIEEFFNNLDDETISLYTSEDLMKILDLKSDCIFKLLDLIKNGHPSSMWVLNDFCLQILEHKRLTKFQIKCIKHLLSPQEACSYDIEKLLFKMIEKRHDDLVKYIINDCKKIEFSLYVFDDLKELFDYLLIVNDFNLVEKISSRKKIKLTYNIGLLDNDDTINIENKYLFFSTLYNKYPYFDESIQQMIDLSMNYNDDENIIEKIDDYSKMNGFLEENGYYIIYLLLRRGKNSLVEYILNNYKNINLNKLIDGMAPIQYACYRKSFKLVELMLNYGANGDFPDKYGDTPLAYACCLRNSKLIKLFYERGFRFQGDELNEELECYIKEKQSYLIPFVYVRKLAEKKLKKRKR